jgi:AcrR family transcriptional regulator
MSVGPADASLSAEDRVLDALRVCCDRWGFERITIDDIATEAGISRATVYRLFPGGKDVMFEAFRARETQRFFVDLRAHVAAADDLEDLVVAVLVEATAGLRRDEHLQTMLASQPGEVVKQMSVDDLPRIVEVATAFLTPLAASHLDPRRAGELAEFLTRLVLSYFFSPSQRVDFSDPGSARDFTRRFVLPAFAAAPAAP